MPATIRDVANLANTSIASVSKVLNNREIRITEEKREEILRAARDLKYVPSRTAKQLKHGSTDTIAIIVPDLLNPFYPKLIKTCIHILNKMDKNVVIFDSDHSVQLESRYIRRLHDRSFDGVLMVPSGKLRDRENNERTLEMLSKVPCPTVFMNKELESKKISSVSTAPFESGYTAGRHLIDNGHRQIAFVSEMMEPADFSEKFRGLSAYANEQGISIDPELVIPGCIRYQIGREILHTLIEKRTTAVFAENDQLAIGIIGAAGQMGIKVPEQLSVMGMDDLYIGRILATPLTTIRQSVGELCSQAIDILLQHIEDDAAGRERQVKRIQLLPELKVRASTADISRL